MTLAGQSQLWAYPWDVLDVGLTTFQRDVTEQAGVGGVSLATSYHAGYFLQPRSSTMRVRLPEDGTVYFVPNATRWDGMVLQPRPAVLLQAGDALRDLLHARDRSGLKITCWTVCLHNTRLGALHPEATMEDAFGQRRPFALCPSHPDARAYVRTLVADLTHTYRPDGVELETPGFMGFRHGHHHEKDGVGLTDEDDILFSLCFCPACLARARAHGLDGVGARTVVRQWLQHSLTRAEPRPRWPSIRADGPDVFADVPAVRSYMQWRAEPVTSLVAEVREAMHPATRLDVILGDAGWTQGMDARALATACDGLVRCAYDRTEDAVGATLRGSIAASEGRPVRAGLRVFMPEQGSHAGFVARVAAAAKAGAAGLNFYNYGLIPAARLNWIRDALVETSSNPENGRE